MKSDPVGTAGTQGTAGSGQPDDLSIISITQHAANMDVAKRAPCPV
jgi:hypothetical protein